MKKILLLSSLLVASTAFAQTDESAYKMSLKLANGSVQTFNVDNITEITFDETAPKTIPFDANNDWANTSTFENGTLTKLFPATNSPENMVWSLAPGALDNSQWVLKFSYQCTSPVTRLEINLFDNGTGFKPAYYGKLDNATHIGIIIDNSGANANEWKEIAVDISNAIEYARWNLDGASDNRFRIHFDGVPTDVARTIKVKDLRLVPKPTQKRKEIACVIDEEGSKAYETVITHPEDGVTALEYQNGKAESYLWLSIPEALPDPNYSLTMTYKCDQQLSELQFLLFDWTGRINRWNNGGSVADWVKFTDFVAQPNEWKTVTINLKNIISQMDWNLGHSGERLRMHPNRTNMVGCTLQVKDIKLVPNN